MEISRCKYCGSEGVMQDNDAGNVPYYGVSCMNYPCYASSPFRKTQEEAIEVWNEMMSPSSTTVLDTTSTDYRDRVDRMVAAAYAGCYSNSGRECWDFRGIIKQTIVNLDAIDAAIKEKMK